MHKKHKKSAVKKKKRRMKAKNEANLAKIKAMQKRGE